MNFKKRFDADGSRPSLNMANCGKSSAAVFRAHDDSAFSHLYRTWDRTIGLLAIQLQRPAFEVLKR